MKLNSELDDFEEQLDLAQEEILKLQDQIREGHDEQKIRKVLADFNAKESVLANKIENHKVDIKLLGRIINQSRKNLTKLRDEIFVSELDDY